MTGTIEDTEAIYRLTRMLENEIETSEAVALDLVELETAYDTLHTEFHDLEEVAGVHAENYRQLIKAREDELNVIKGFVQTGDFLVLAEYLQVDVPIPGGKRVQVGDWLETEEDYANALVGTVVLFDLDTKRDKDYYYTKFQQGWASPGDVVRGEYESDQALGGHSRFVDEVPA